jgi:excisionase family DNA binding protein
MSQNFKPITMDALIKKLAGAKVEEEAACQETGKSPQQLQALARKRGMKMHVSYERGELNALKEDLATREVPKGLYSRSEAAILCGRDEETISRWVRNGKLKVAHRVGRRAYFRREDLDAAVTLAHYGQRMSEVEVCALLNVSGTQLWTLRKRGLFPYGNRDQRYRTSEVYAWRNAVEVNPSAPFGDPGKDAIFRMEMATIERDNAQRKASIAAHLKREEDERAELTRRSEERKRRRAGGK